MRAWLEARSVLHYVSINYCENIHFGERGSKWVHKRANERSIDNGDLIKNCMVTHGRNPLSQKWSNETFKNIYHKRNEMKNWPSKVENCIIWCSSVFGIYFTMFISYVLHFNSIHFPSFHLRSLFSFFKISICSALFPFCSFDLFARGVELLLLFFRIHGGSVAHEIDIRVWQ